MLAHRLITQRSVHRLHRLLSDEEQVHLSHMFMQSMMNSDIRNKLLGQTKRDFFKGFALKDDVIDWLQSLQYDSINELADQVHGHNEHFIERLAQDNEYREPER